jgi:hypothetical protein
MPDSPEAKISSIHCQADAEAHDIRPGIIRLPNDSPDREEL